MSGPAANVSLEIHIENQVPFLFSETPDVTVAGGRRVVDQDVELPKASSADWTILSASAHTALSPLATALPTRLSISAGALRASRYATKGDPVSLMTRAAPSRREGPRFAADPSPPAPVTRATLPSRRFPVLDSIHDRAADGRHTQWCVRNANFPSLSLGTCLISAMTWSNGTSKSLSDGALIRAAT
jgi:hypothetical protein